MSDVQPFNLSVPQGRLDDLRERLARTRWPEPETVDDWSQGVPLAAILLFISNVGVRLALIVLFLYAAAIIAAPVFLGFFLGALLWRGAMKKAPCYYAELAIGILVWRVAAGVPGLSFAVGLVSVPLGLGVVTLLLGKGAAKPSPKAETACEESAASDPAALPEDSDSAEQ